MKTNELMLNRIIALAVENNDLDNEIKSQYREMGEMRTAIEEAEGFASAICDERDSLIEALSEANAAICDLKQHLEAANKKLVKPCKKK